MEQEKKDELRQRFVNLAGSLYDEIPCSGCGRCVLVGPPCCEVKAAEVKAWWTSPEGIEYLKRDKLRIQAAKAEKAATKAAKRARREARKAAKL
jgi:hypothetical protein